MLEERCVMYLTDNECKERNKEVYCTSSRIGSLYLFGVMNDDDGYCMYAW